MHSQQYQSQWHSQYKRRKQKKANQSKKIKRYTYSLSGGGKLKKVPYSKDKKIKVYAYDYNSRFNEVRLRNIKSDKVKYPSVWVSAYKCIKRLAPDMYKFGIFHIHNPEKESVNLILQNEAFLCNQALPWTSDWIGGFECNDLTDFEKLRLVFYKVSDYVRKDNKNIQTNQSVQLVVEVNFWGDIYEEDFFYAH